ncbi:MAG TPA: DUF6776 family protein [Steroidobacteraceae bacterium]|nr:DUF6776 family protein [Steroidobacteraceae bacterium]
MAELPTNLVIRRRAPLRGLLLTLGGALLLVMGLYALYELGRYDAGYDRLAVSEQRTELEVKLDKLEQTNRELRIQLAELDTLKVGRAQERAEISRTIGDLQAQVARQSQELAFYRGVIAQEVNARGQPEGGVYIQQLHIRALPGTQHFLLHLALLQGGRGESTVSGTLLLTLEGSADGHPATLDFPAMTGGKDAERGFSFRYFEELDQEVTLPPTFQPERLNVQVRSSHKGIGPLDQSFPWRVEPS